MKYYICRRGKPDFVCNADSAADAIVLFWMAEKETPKASYRIHEGRRRKSRVFSSAVAYWRLSVSMRSALTAVLRETTSEEQFNEFCETVITVADLLGE